MNIDIPRYVEKIIDKLENSGFEAYIVGGCVRDSIMGCKPKDYDVTTSAKPDEIKKCFSDPADGFKIIETGIRHGTVTIVSDNENIEVTTFRTDGEYIGHRQPLEVRFARSLTEDLARRDFTINAMAYNKKIGLIDSFGGQRDLFNRKIVCVGKPELRFDEDALRIMRALRFASELNFKITDETAAAIHGMRNLLTTISAERVASEFMLLLMGIAPKRTLTRFSDVMEVIIPEVKPCVGFQQHSKYYSTDLWTHMAAAVEYSKPIPEVRLALMLHDIGKPICFSLDDEGNGNFSNHERISSEMAEAVLGRLHFPNNTIQRVSKLIKYHYFVPVNDTRVIRKLLSAVGEKDFFMLIELMKGNNRAKENCFERVHTLEIMQAKAIEIIESNQCIRVSDLAVSGSDMITLGFSGKEIGAALEELLDAVLDDRVSNIYTELISYAKKYCKNVKN